MKILTGRWLHTLILIGLLSGALLVRMQDYDWSKSLRFLAFDSFNHIKPRAPRDDVVIIDIDEGSMARPDLGQWPWSRDRLAQLVTNLSEMGARAIVFDIVFAERDRTSPQVILERMSADDPRQNVAPLLAQLPDNDELFARALRSSERAVTGFIWSGSAEAGRIAPVLSQPVIYPSSAAPLEDHVPRIRAVVNNIPLLSRAAAGNGHFGVQPEIDGIIRSVPLLFSFRDPAQDERAVLYPSLATEALRVAQGARTTTRIRALRPEETGLFDPPLKMSIGSYEVPLDWDGRFYVHFAPARPDRYLPAWQAIEGLIAPEQVRDKIVLVGTSAEGLRDIRSTPLDLFIPGVEVHMNVIEQILSGEYLLRPRLLEGAELMTIVVVGTLIILLAPFVGAIFMAGFVFTLVAAIAALSWHGFNQHGLLLDPVYPGLSLLALFVLSSLLAYIRTEAERKQVREAFGLYISPDFMEELTKDPDKLKLGGETKELTVMFTDIRNFTSISENFTPEELTRLMNDFLTPMSDLVMGHRGTIDKYMGDAMMAFWNAPLDVKDHARYACRTALQMNRALGPLNEKLARQAQEHGKAPVVLEAGIGVNTGPASVGNMGSKQRFAYSALGDNVNLASRLEGQTKQYGVRILAGEQTYLQASDFAMLELDLIRVKGRREPERIYVLLGDETMAQSEYFQSWKDIHDRMIARYRAQDFDAALALAGQCQEISKDGMTGFYDMFMARLQNMKTAPPGKGWDGVYVATSK